MSYIFAFILIAIIIWILFGQYIKRWAQRRVMEKMEDAFRAQMGMPSGKEERKRRRRAEKDAQRGGERRTGRKTQWTHHEGNSQRGADSALQRLKEYAEDVEYVEYKEYSSTTVIAEETDDSGKRRKVIIEEQVTDAEYTIYH